ncbi:hypothetical protein Taro_040053 [Colocasia esculenta]|uniref:RING-type E3 ubiquitin transferase n=1 Tax=Colocasia esculenta TaxID=4460 RepID=A0A843W7Z0_COLES|nr:hypothetical protein [Colocasia esculenta]
MMPAPIPMPKPKPPPKAISSPSSPSTPSNLALLRTLLHTSRDISLFEPPPRAVLLRSRICSAARKAALLALLFEELLREPQLADALPRSAVLCLREILVVLGRLRALMESCSSWMSRVRLALQLESAANDFHEVTHDLSTLLDIFPLSELELGDDVRDLVGLLRGQCRRSSASADPEDERLRSEILGVISDMEREIAPDYATLEGLFERLGLRDAGSCREEIERLEVEIRDRVYPKKTAAMVALLGLIRYGKCLLFGASTPRRYRTEEEGNAGSGAFEAAIPVDFRCPISLDLMKDPVIVTSGQTYDRESIGNWIASGHATCPKTGQVLSNSELVPNKALKNIISRWCHQHNVPFETADAQVPADPGSVSVNKAALEAARMTALFLVRELAASPSGDSANRIVHELRQLAKVNAVAALLNLSILSANKKRIMQAAGGLDGVVHVLRSGATWQAKENAAATLLSLSSYHVLYRKKVARDPRVAEGLVELVRSGPSSSKRDGLVTMLNLAGERDNIARLVEGGVVEAALEAAGVPDMAEIAVAVVAAVAKRGGAPAVAANEGAIGKLAGIMRLGTDQAKESAAAALVSVCRHGGGDAVAELATTSGIEWVIWNLMGSGSVRGRRKAASLGRICRRWAVSQEEDVGPASTLDSISVETTVPTAAIT